MPEFEKYIKSGNWVLYLFLLVAVVVFAVVLYMFFSVYKKWQDVPKYKLVQTPAAAENVSRQTIDEQSGSTKESKPISQNIPTGFLSLSFSNDMYGEPIVDSVAINSGNSYQIYASDNNPEYSYKSYKVNNRGHAIFLAKKNNEDKWHLMKGKVVGAKLPNIYNSKTLFVFSGNTPISFDLNTRGDVLIEENENDASYIYMLSKGETDKQKVTEGSSPRWISREMFVYTKDNSLYLFDIGAQKSHKLWDAASDFALLDVSSDGQTLGLYLPKFKRLTLLRFKGDKENPSLEEFNSFAEEPAGFAISSDGSFVALLVKHDDKNHIKIFNSKDGSEMDSVFKNSRAFDFYRSDYVRLNDWY